MRALTCLGFVADVLLALVVFADARRRGLAFGGESPSGSQLGAPGWGLGVLVMPVLFLPAYFVKLWRISSRPNLAGGRPSDRLTRR
jgi:hypothetical protein